MATVSKWTPFGVALDITATAGTVTRTSATKFTVKINASWETYYSGAATKYGMTASSGGGSVTLKAFSNTAASSGSGSFTGTYSISGNGSATKTITVTFRNFNDDNGDSATKTVSFNVTVPAWTSYTITYNANGGSGAPGSQTKWKDQTLTLSSTKPTRTGYSFLGWSTSSSATTATYSAGGSYTANSAATLYAVWKANTYTVSYNANGGSRAPSSQTKTHGVTLKLSSTVPTRSGYAFVGWGTSASATTVAYAAGGNYTTNASITLYAIWEVDYTPPRIFNVTVVRCDDVGSEDDAGTFALVSFDWESDTLGDFAYIWWKPASGSEWTYEDHSIGGATSGHVDHLTGDGQLDPDTSYDIQLHVDDINGTSYVSKTLTTEKYSIDFLSEGKGVAFGKVAEFENTADFQYEAVFRAPVSGKALGMDRLPAIPEGSDFNGYMETGCYAVQSNAIAETCTNIPVARAGRLEVWSSTGEGIRAQQWSYIRQRYIPYNSTNAVWERELTRGEDNVWHFYDWWRSSLTPAASEKVYSIREAMTISLSANTVLGVTNSYTKVPLDKTAMSTLGGRLTMEDNSIKIGSNIQYVKVSGQLLLKCGSTAGNRHVRIQKITNGATGSIAWSCVYGAAASNTPYLLTPIIVKVSEGDLLRMVFYTSDAADSIASGSSANGWQTYLTVEEL